MMLARKVRTVAMVAVAGLAMVLGTGTQAMAQGRGGDRGGMFGGMFGGGQMQVFEPSVSSRDLDSFAKLFGLDATQKEAVSTLFDGYQQQFLAAAKKAREEIEALRDEARESGDRSLFQEIGEKSTAFQKSRQDMETSFLNDFKVVLSDDQATKWPKFERTRRRDTTIGRGLMSGERVNLFAIVDDLKLDAAQRATVDPLLEQYEVDLDRELIERNKMYEEMQGKMRELFTNPEGADEIIKKGRDISVKVRDVNRRYARQLETQLPEDKKSAFDTAFRRESFPQVYRESYYNRVVDAAGNLEGLEESQKSTLASIRDSYYRDLQTVQRDMEKAQEEQEMNFSMSAMMGGRRGGGNEGGGRRGMFGESEAMTTLREKRRELERGTEEKIKAMLNAQQLEKLPTRGEDGNAGPGGRERGDGDQAPRRRGGDNSEGGGRRPNRNE